MSREEIDRRVATVIAETLAKPHGDVSLEHVLMHDLGAESLDFLDIVFRLEREFQIQITRGEMEAAARGDLSEEAFAPDGVISSVGLDRLRQLMPEAQDRIVPGLRPVQILSLFSVRTFANIVAAKLCPP